MTLPCNLIAQRVFRLWSILLCYFLCGLAYAVSAHALADTDMTTVTIENDLFIPGNNDRYYSGGWRVAYMTDSAEEFSDDNSPRWMRQLFGDMPLIQAEGYSRSASYGIGQVIVTPEDISLTTPQPNDLPYAGLLYGFYTLDGYGQQHAEAVTVLAGVVGPWSLAEKSQKLLHELTHSQRPQGWDHQLKNEPVINVDYNYSYLFHSVDWQKQWSADLVGSGSLFLGNVMTGGSLNIVAFVGQSGSYNPLNFRSDILVRSNFHTNGTYRSGFYAFAGTGVDRYLHNIFLDGNSFRDGPSVEKIPYVYNRFVGLGYNWLDYNIHFTWFDQNHIFVGQQGHIEYGSLNFTWRH